MTIHHDKLAYGKLASSVEELSDDEIAKMLKELSEADGEEIEQENKEQSKKSADGQ